MLPQSANVALFGNYMAASFVAGGIHGGTVTAEAAGSQAMLPLLTHAHTG